MCIEGREMFIHLLQKVVKIFSETNISVIFTHAFKIKSFTNMFMWIKIINCTRYSWLRKSRSLEYRICLYITDLVCYTHFHWSFNHECQHKFGKQTVSSNQIKKFYLKSVHFITVQHKLSRAFQTDMHNKII